jgi:hypothetical protein
MTDNAYDCVSVGEAIKIAEACATRIKNALNCAKNGEHTSIDAGIEYDAILHLFYKFPFDARLEQIMKKVEECYDAIQR